MEIITSKIDPKNEKQTQGKAFRLSLGQGCTLPNCNCSPGNWAWLSNGETAFQIRFTEEEAQQIREGFLMWGQL